MRRIKASFKQMVGLKLTNPSHKIWVKYFANDYPKILPSANPKSPLQARAKEFNIERVKDNTLYTEADSIEQNPDEYLPRLLKFDQPISIQYFKFAQLMSQENLREPIAIGIINEVSPHLIRASICWFYQVEIYFNDLIQNQSNKFFPLSYVDDYMLIMKVLLAGTSKSRDEYLIVLYRFLKFIQSNLTTILQLPDEYSIAQIPKKIASFFAHILEGSKEFPLIFCPAISYISIYSINCITTSKYDDSTTEILEMSITNVTSKFKLKDLVTGNASADILTLITKAFQYYSKKPFEEIMNHINIAITILGFLQNHSPIVPEALIKSGNQASSINLEMLAQSILDLGRTIFISYFPKEPALMEIEPPKFSENIFENINHDFIEFQYKYGKPVSQISSGKQASLISSVFMQSRQTVTFFLKIANICERDPTLSGCLIKQVFEYFKDSHSIVTQYYVISILLSGDSTAIASVLNRSKNWTNILNDASFLELDMTGRELMDMTNTLVLLAFTSRIIEHVKLVDTIENLMSKPYLSRVLELTLNLFEARPGSFIDSMRASSIFDIIYELDSKCRSTMIFESEREDLIHIRKMVIQFIQLSTQTPSGILQLFAKQSRSDYLFSLLFENNAQSIILDVIQCGLCHEIAGLIIENINNLICASLNKIQEPKWMSLFTKIIDCINISLETNGKVISDGFISSGCLSTFNRVGLTCENEEFTMKIFDMYTHLSMKSTRFVWELKTPSWNFVPAWLEIFKKKEIDEHTIQLLERLTYLEENPERYTLIRNVEGLRLLIQIAEGTKFLTPVLQKLSQLAFDSPINRYHCSLAGVIQSLLKYEINKNDNTVLELLSLVGSSFFTPSELAHMLHKLTNVESNDSIPLLETFLEIMKYSSMNEPPTYFHIDEKNPGFHLGPFNATAKFTFSCMIRLEKHLFDSDDEKTLFRFSSPNQELRFYFTGRTLQFHTAGMLPMRVSSAFQDSVWFSLHIAITPNKIVVYQNQNQVSQISFIKRFYFVPPLVTIDIANAACDIEQITWFDYAITPQYFAKGQGIAIYSAKVMKDGICPNTFSGEQDTCGEAHFDGYALPYSLRVTHAIANSGGVRVFLPLFTNIKQSINPTKYLDLLLQIVQSIVYLYEPMMYDQQFFRAISYLLPAEFVTTENLDCLKDIYLSFTNQATELKIEMLIHIWSNMDFWASLKENVRQYFISTALREVFENDKALFITQISVKTLLIGFLAYFKSHKNENNLMAVCWEFLELILNYSFSEGDCFFLLASTIVQGNFECADASLKLVYRLIYRKNSTLIKLLQNNNVYQPLFPVLNSFDENLRLKGMNTVYLLNSLMKKEYNLSKIIISGFHSYQLAQTTKQSFNQIASYIFGLIEPGGGVDILQQDIELVNVQYVRYPEFIPILCFTMHLFNQDDQIRFCNAMRRSIKEIDSSQLSILECSHWPFWLLFLSNVDNQTDDWVIAISNACATQIRQNSNFNLLEVEYYILIYCITFNKPWGALMHVFFTNLLGNLQTYKIISEVFRYIFFIKQERIQTENFEENDLHLVAHHVIFGNFSGHNFTYSMRKDEHGKWADIDLAITAAKYVFMNNDIAGFSVKISDDYSIPIVILATLIIHQLSIINSPETNSLIEPCINMLNTLYFEKTIQKRCLSILLVDFPKESERLISILKRIDPTYDESFVNECTGEVSATLASLTQGIEPYQKAFEHNFNVVYSALKEDLECLFATSGSQNIVISMSMELSESTEASEKAASRLARQNMRLWNTIERSLKNNGGPWSSEMSDFHWKVDKQIDVIGRRMKMTVNHNFNQHIDASKARSSDIQEEDTRFMDRRLESMAIKEDDKKDRKILFQLACQMVTISSYYRGYMFFTEDALIYEADQITDCFGETKAQTNKIVEMPSDITQLVLRRRYLHEDTAAEVFLTNRRSYFFIFAGQERKKFFSKLGKMRISQDAIIQTKSSAKLVEDLQISRKWREGKMNTYEYLYWLNIFSGRSFNDISQYPVFPWVLKNYTSEKLDLNDPENYRDLSEPIGHMNVERFNRLEELYQEIKDTPIASLYRFFYSNPAYVIHYLIRCEPFTTLHIQLQNGRFDHPSRLFSSIPDSWKSCISTNPDFRELIPEFFSFSEMFMNTDKFDLGLEVDDVVLPKWAKNAAEFIVMNRLALESKHASANMHEWINLIFGPMQQSIEHHNLYHPYSHPDSIAKYPEDMLLIQNHAANFGIMPERLFKWPHMPRIFVPFTPKFSPDEQQKLNFVNMSNVPSNIIKMWCLTDSLYVMCYPGTVYQLNFTQQNQQFQKYSKIPLHLPAALAKPSVIEKHIAVLPHLKCIIATNPWSETFNVIDYSESKGRVIFTPQGHATAITSCDANSYSLVTAAEDSSLFLWSIQRRRMVASILAHNHKIVDVGFSALLDLIVSIDVNKRLSYSSSIKRSFYRSTILEAVPDKVEISSLGFVIVFIQERNLGEISTIIKVYDLSQRVIASSKIAGTYSSHCICVFTDCSQYIFLAMSTQKCFFLRIPDLKHVAHGELTDVVTSCTFSPYHNTLFLALQSGNLYSCVIE